MDRGSYQIRDELILIKPSHTGEISILHRNQLTETIIYGFTLKLLEYGLKIDRLRSS